MQTYQRGHGLRAVHALAELVGLVDEEDAAPGAVQLLLHLGLRLAQVLAGQVEA